MSAGACRAVLEAAPTNKRAPELDAAFPHCACEPWALTSTNGAGIPDDEIVARVLTSPDAYDETHSSIITARFTQLYSMGLSVIRKGASDSEIKGTIDDLLHGAAEEKKLVGAIVTTAGHLRLYTNDDDKARWFGIYATDDRQKLHHADVLGTTTNRKKQSDRRHQLAADMLALIVHADTREDLLAALRHAGI